MAIVFFLPREGRFKYEFQKGKPWLHENLFAPFDFPVHKSEQEIVAEKNKILRDFKPFFHYDSTTVTNVIDLIRSEYKKQFNTYQLKTKLKPAQSKPIYFDKIERAIVQMYRRGVIDVTEIQSSKALSQGTISLLINNIAYETPLSDVYTPTTAVEHLQSVCSRITELDDGVEAKLIRQFPFATYIQPNLFYDASSSEKYKNSMLVNLSTTRGLVQTGERIITEGEVVSNESYRVLESLKFEYESRLGFSHNSWMLILGQGLLVSILFLILYLFLLNFRREVLLFDLKVLFILLLISIVTISSSFVLKSSGVSIYLIPFAIVPIFIRVFYDARLALFIHLVTIFLVAFFVPNGFEFVFVSFIAGVVAILSLTNLYRRGKLFLTVSLVLLSYVIVFIGLTIIQEGSLTAVNPMYLLWFTGNALLLLASYQLIYLFEKIFGFLSDTTLMEISDTNQDLLRKLAEVAPGTFQHSLQVANLAEAAIQKIGGNALLVRAGALYHDIGKMNNPFYFIENQSPEFNPHNNLDFEESAEIIIKHVPDGIALAQKHRLPEQLIEFISMHHGTSKVQYFFRLYRDKYPEMKDEFQRFVYPGPKPNAKETAVLMMADSVEAASRTLKSITHQSIDNLVESIINQQQLEEQFNESNITFKDIPIIKQVFKKKLLNIYHARIEYPEKY
jgi:putative nucleotidyltransferase with HDIG domain